MGNSNVVTKVFCVVIAVIAMAYIVFAAVVLWYLPKKIEMEESRLPGIQQAIKECAADQLLLSKRVNAITDQGMKDGKSKVIILSRMLSDVDLNRLASNYIGSDFATTRSSFLSAVKHSRDLLKSQEAIYVKEEERKDVIVKKLKRLESRKKFLLNAPKNAHDRRVDYLELADIDDQIAHYRGIEWSRELKNESGKDTYVHAGVQLESHLFKLATDCERNTLITLERIIAERKGTFVKDEQRTVMLRTIYDKLNIWPLPALRRLFFGGNQSL